jgi:hypothetical protein
MGDVIGDLNAPAGKGRGNGPRAAPSTRGRCRWRRCSATRRIFARGRRSRATYTMQFSHYAAVPKPVSDEIVARIRGH